MLCRVVFDMIIYLQIVLLKFVKMADLPTGSMSWACLWTVNTSLSVLHLHKNIKYILYCQSVFFYCLHKTDFLWFTCQLYDSLLSFYKAETLFSPCHLFSFLSLMPVWHYDNVLNPQVCGGWDPSLWDEDVDGREGDGMILADEMDCRSHNSSPVRRRTQQRLSKAKGVLNRSCSVPDSNNPPCLSTPPHGDISTPVSDLTEIGADEHFGCRSLWSKRLQRLNRGQSCESYPRYGAEDGEETGTRGANIQEHRESQSKGNIQGRASPCVSCQELEMEGEPSEDQSTLNHSLCILNNYMTKSMLCLNEESQDEVRPSQRSGIPTYFRETILFKREVKRRTQKYGRSAISTIISEITTLDFVFSMRRYDLQLWRNSLIIINSCVSHLWNTTIY